MKTKNKLKLKTQTSITAHIFLIPFYIGLIVFFIGPLINSAVMSMSNVSVTDEGYKYEFIKFSNYKYAFVKDAAFGTNIVNSITEMLWKTPVINIFAIFLALIANQKMKCKTIVRAIFFMPLVFASSVAFNCITTDSVASSIMSGSEVSGGVISNTNALKELLISSGLGNQLVNLVTKITDGIFSMAWASGVQMILYLAALQSISPSLYEASQIEGASSWDNFWKITLPMLMPIMLTCIVYTVVDNFTSTSNVVMKQITELSRQGVNSFGLSSAFSWIYTLIMLVLLLLTMLLFSKADGNKKGV